MLQANDRAKNEIITEKEENEMIEHEKKITIVVNGREKQVETEEVTFEQIVALAFDNPPTGKFICFTLTYWRGGGRKPEGTLIESGSVKVKEGTVFNVTVTDKS